MVILTGGYGTGWRFTDSELKDYRAIHDPNHGGLIHEDLPSNYYWLPFGLLEDLMLLTRKRIFLIYLPYLNHFQIILISGLVLSQLLAVGEAGAIFLLISPGAGPAGSGEAGRPRLRPLPHRRRTEFVQLQAPRRSGVAGGQCADGRRFGWAQRCVYD